MTAKRKKKEFAVIGLGPLTPHDPVLYLPAYRRQGENQNLAKDCGEENLVPP